MIFKPSEMLPDNDAFSKEDEIYITWKNKGDSMVAYEVIIENNSTGIQVYTSGKTTAYSGKHTIPANTLSNGIVYRYKIKVYNSIDEYAISSYKIFSCYSKPIVEIPNDGYIRNQIMSINALYNQAEDLPLNAYKFTLYDEYGNILEESDYLYDGLLTYEFNYRLDNEIKYFVECMAIATNGVYGSRKIQLIAQYLAPTVYFKMEATVPDRENYVQLAWSTVRIIGEPDKPVIYLNNETLADLTDNKVVYNDGFVLPVVFSLRMWIKNITEKVNLIELSSEHGNVKIQYYDKRFHAFRNINSVATHIATDEITISTTEDLIYVCFQQLNDKEMNLYSEVI